MTPTSTPGPQPQEHFLPFSSGNSSLFCIPKTCLLGWFSTYLGCFLNPASSRRTGLLSALLFLLQAGRQELRSQNRKSLPLPKGCGDVPAAWTSPSHELGAGTPQEELLLVSPLFSGEIWRRPFEEVYS